MVICEDLLFSHGATAQIINSQEYIFQEGTTSKFYFQIKKGTVKINNFTVDGKEFIHGLPFDGHCFGESYIFTQTPYGVNAVAVIECEVIKLEKEKFVQLLLSSPQLFLKINKYTAERLHFRYLISTFLCETDPLIRITKLLNYMKGYFKCVDKYSFIVPYTRTQLASLTGLRIETVIRTIKKMEIYGHAKIIDRKIYY